MIGVYVWTETHGKRSNVVRVTVSSTTEAERITGHYKGKEGYHGNVITGGKVAYSF